MGYLTTVVTITDTGKRRTSSASAEESDLAYGGSAIELKGVELSYEESALLNSNPVISKYSTPSDQTTAFTHGEVDHIGIGQPMWTVRGVLDLNTSFDRTTIQFLRQLPRTKGYKILSGDVPDHIDGVKDASTVNVRVQSVRMIHRSNSNLIDYTIKMIETA